MPKSKNFAAKAAFATLRPPLQCDLQLSAEKHNHITHAAVTTRNLEAATPLRSANNELQNAIELRTQAPQIMIQPKVAFEAADAEVRKDPTVAVTGPG